MTDHDHDRADGTPRENVRESAHETVDGAARPGEPPVDLKAEVLKGLGGPSGMVYSALPVVVFAAAVPFLSLLVAIGISIAVALVLTALRMWRGEQFAPAMGGVIGVVAAGGIAALTGSANDFFLIGIWVSLVGAVVMLVSLVVRRPLTGMIWNAVHGNTHPWRKDRPSLRVHDLATLAVMAMLAARFAVRQWLYLADSTTGLAIADTVTGFPLTALAAVVVIWAFRRSTKRLIKSAGASAAPRV
ncbi:DUF3159 domain-containing protein [Nocardiopsis ansamitocini]|uniref:Membrane protein n=1 Tax=Nocardiopsis ansamitocini TaxID=1670832 RepID=A0A9W6UHV8_9ACTN|nr:DUF3159 domain-containing protein [Nocardiopsis ansamitocini]GLU47102.1 membrane protein [Nocardiopsis ansamitocini]